MSILDRYLLTAFGRILGLALGSFAGVYLLVDFFEKVDKFLSHHAGLGQYLIYFASKLPLIMVQVLPLAILMAVFLTLGGFSRTSELTAMRAGGFSLWRLSAPLLGSAILAALLTLAANEYLVPVCARTMQHVYEVEVRGKPPLSVRQENVWFKENDAIVHIRVASADQGRLEGITIYRLDGDNRLLSRTEARHAAFGDGEWLLRDGSIRRFAPATGEVERVEPFAERRGELAKPPADFASPGFKGREMGIRELSQLARKVAAEGYDATRYRVDLQAQMATPFACVVMAFLGIPFALRKGRGASLAAGIAISVGIGVTYFILQAALQAFGYSSVLPPLVAAWSANLLFTLLGIWLLLQARE